MKTDLVYELVDMRHTATPMEGFGRISSIPGGIQVQDSSGHLHTLLFEDDPDAFRDEESAGIIDIRTDDGRVVLESLRLTNWLEELEPFWDTPDFKTDAEVQAYFWSKLEEAAR